MMKFSITVLPRIDQPWRTEKQMLHYDVHCTYIVQVYFMFYGKSTDVHDLFICVAYIQV